MRRVGNALLVIAAAAMLFFAQSARWINNDVFNQTKFTNSVMRGIQLESSRTAIATAVVDASLKDRPLVRQYAGGRIISVTAGLLNSDVSSQALGFVSDRFYAYLTSPKREDVTINLIAIKQPLSQIIELARNPDTADKLESINEQIPNEVTILQAGDLPDLSGTVKAMLWLEPLLWFGAISLFGLYVYIGREQYAKRVYIVGAAVVVVAIFGTMTYPFVPPTVMAAMPNIELRPLADNLSKQFLGSFRAQMLQMLAVTTLALLLFNQRYNLQRALKHLVSKIPTNK